MSRGWIAALVAAAIVSLGHVDAAVADPAEVDLRDAGSLERLREQNPAHYAAIRQILAELSEHPEKIETDWLQATFDARDVERSRLLFKTSHPPRQMLRFTLDETRYALHVVRSDLVAEPALLR